MDIAQICHQIKARIASIFKLDRELAELTAIAHSKSREAVPLLREMVKEAAPLCLKYGRTGHIFSYQEKKIYWHSRHGLAISEDRPLEPDEGKNYPIENLINSVYNELGLLIAQLENQKKSEAQRTEKLDAILAALKEAKDK